MAKKTTTPTATPAAPTTTTPPTSSINQKGLSQRIKKTIPKPKRHKWQQIGAKALAGDQGALSRLSKRGLIKPGQAQPTTPDSGGKSGSSTTTPSSGSSSSPTLTSYKPPSITDEQLAKSPVSVGGGKYHDTITGLDVSADFGPNPYNPGGATAEATAPSSAAKDSTAATKQAVKALPGAAKAKKGTVPLVYRTPTGFVTRHVGRKRAHKIITRRNKVSAGKEGEGIAKQTQKKKKQPRAHT